MLNKSWFRNLYEGQLKNLSQINPIIIMFYMYYNTHITTKSGKHNLTKVKDNLK